MSSIKIFITYKQRNPILKSDILTPIQSGRSIAPEIFDEMIGDDTGDNVSSLNGKFSELSAIYWAWKNYDKIGSPEYVGFMHYRRQFVFDERLALPYPKWISSFYYIPSLQMARPYFSDESISDLVPQFDLLIPQYHVTPTRTIKEEYVAHIPGSHGYIFDEFIKICRELYPDYEEEICKIENGNIVSVCNMFIMKKELFFKYCEFAFPVLFELEKRIDSTGFTENGLRFLGYMAEKLQTMFTMKIEKNVKVRYLNCLYIRPDIRKNDALLISPKPITVPVSNLSPQKKKIKKLIYRILKNISFGKLKLKFRDKYNKYKA